MGPVTIPTAGEGFIMYELKAQGICLQVLTKAVARDLSCAPLSPLDSPLLPPVITIALRGGLKRAGGEGRVRGLMPRPAAPIAGIWSLSDSITSSPICAVARTSAR